MAARRVGHSAHPLNKPNMKVARATKRSILRANATPKLTWANPAMDSMTPMIMPAVIQAIPLK